MKRPIKRGLAVLLATVLAATAIFGGIVPSVAGAATSYPWTRTATASSGNYIADSYGLPVADTVIENVPTDRLLDILSAEGTHYVLFSNPSDQQGASALPQQVVPLINAKAKELGIKKIYHFDTVLDDWQLDITGTVTTATASGAVQNVNEPASWAGSTLNKVTVSGTTGVENYADVDASAADIGGVNGQGHIATWVGRIWTIIQAKFPGSLSEISAYESGDVLLVRFTKATHQTLPSAATAVAAHFVQGTTYTTAAVNTALDGVFKSGSSVVAGSERSQYEFFKRTYNVAASYFNTSNVTAPSYNRVGTGVELFKDSDFPNGAGFKFKAVTVPELYNILNSNGYKAVLFASTACHNTQAIIGQVALTAKTSDEVQTVYVLEPALSGTALFGEGANVDKLRFASATGGIHIRNNRQLTGATLSAYQYSYLYGEIVRQFIPNLTTEQQSKQSEGNSSGSIGFYQDGVVDDFITGNSVTWTDTYPWDTGARKASARLQIPYLLGYDKASGQTKTWLHRKVLGLTSAIPVQYSEYMLELSSVLGIQAVKDSVAADKAAIEAGTKTDYTSIGGNDQDGLDGYTFAQEAVRTLTNVLPQPAAVVKPSAFTIAPTPSISGKAQVGQTLVAVTGTWKPAATLSYQWKANGVNIAGATGQTYKVTGAVLGKKISVTVTGQAEGYTTTAKTSASTATVTTTFTKAPKPTIKGTAKVGKKLSVKVGTWKPKPKFSYQWYANGKKIKKATKSTLKLTKSLKGKKITVKVTGKKTNYVTKTVTSKATKKVKK
ncbi:MAG: hypothetical protein LBS17_05230 [Actinomycetes bacterium]|jgi:hypothetical protein|nr:hypothetical protein [Actinomycetes bacterium]